jgi:hypothetical protein
LIGTYVPSAHAMAERHEIAITSAGKRHVGMVFQEANEFSGDQDVTGYEIRRSRVKRRRHIRRA